MNPRRITDWKEIMSGAKTIISILLIVLLSPLWITGITLRSISRLMSGINEKISSFLVSWAEKTSSTLQDQSHTLHKIILYTVLILLVAIETAVGVLLSLVIFVINIVAFPLYLPYYLLSRPFSLVSESKEKASEWSKIEKSSSERLRISIAYPKLLSKRFEGTFLFQTYSTKNRSTAMRVIRTEFQGEQIIEQTASSSVQVEQKIKIKMFSPQIDFSNEITKVIGKGITKFTFLGVPKDNCQPGFHKVLISIIDAATGNEFESMTIKVNVTDFAFDHVSKPLLSKASSVLLAIGSLAMFTLSLLEQIDKTIGLTSGTAAGVLATIIYVNFFNLYQRTRLNTP